MDRLVFCTERFLLVRALVPERFFSIGPVPEWFLSIGNQSEIVRGFVGSYFWFGTTSGTGFQFGIFHDRTGPPSSHERDTELSPNVLERSPNVPNVLGTISERPERNYER